MKWFYNRQIYKKVLNFHFQWAKLLVLGIIIARYANANLQRYSIMTKQKVEKGSRCADDRYKIVIKERGPYLLYGAPPMAVQRIVVNDFGESWNFEEGEHFSTDQEPTALCRCGRTKSAPYCDESHLAHKWSPKLTARAEGILDSADITAGDNLILTDSPKYCAFARFCDAGGGVWAAVESSFDEISRRLAMRQASLCPSGRLMVWENERNTPHERNYEPSIGLIEDEQLNASGPIWVRGGIRIEREGGSAYEVRNRVTLCRCGESANKPYCDGTHAAIGWRDGIKEKQTVAEEV